MQKKQYTAAFKAQVVQEALKETQTLTQRGAIYGVHPTVIANWKAIALKGLPSLLEKDRSQLAAEKAAQEKEVNDLYAEVGRLTTQVAWLEKKLASRSRHERLSLIDREDAELPLTVRTELLGLSRSGL